MAAPSAAKRLAAKMPTMSGSACSAPVTISAARAGWFWLYWTPRDWNASFSATAASKPSARASVVLIPGSTPITRTLPPSGLASSMAANAAAPPPTLSEAICDTTPDGSSSVVSTRTTSIPASMAAWIGRRIAVTSVGAMSSASGAVATTESTIGVCRVGSNSCGPCVSTVTPSSAAASSMPHCMVM